MPEPTTAADETTAARKKTDAPEPTPAAVTEPGSDLSLCEPYPGETFFHGGRHSPVIVAMARRLEAEDCGDGRYLGADWTTAHRDAFACWQRQLRPKGAGDVSGIPDETAWDRLRVPRVTPLPKET
ncbi:hypothetical protein ACIP2X_37805 [Streptomyces sp. NPDC089424]|uniref:hypothetical protein n=1 Tax=Streptomyces sp. NPDC089424 TaxID=3365917 RepID=UPI0037F51119